MVVGCEGKIGDLPDFQFLRLAPLLAIPTKELKNNKLLTLSTRDPFQSNPPEANHSCVMINMKECYLIVLLTEKEKHLPDEEITHTIIRSHL